MANIRKETWRHDWHIVNANVPGPNLGKNIGKMFLCKNCRAYRYGENATPPVDGCLSDVKVRTLGKDRQHDHFIQERRLYHAQERREFLEEIAAGARRPDGSIIYE